VLDDENSLLQREGRVHVIVTGGEMRQQLGFASRRGEYSRGRRCSVESGSHSCASGALVLKRVVKTAVDLKRYGISDTAGYANHSQRICHVQNSGIVESSEKVPKWTVDVRIRGAK
jgi:hypothetical protein